MIGIGCYYIISEARKQTPDFDGFWGFWAIVVGLFFGCIGLLNGKTSIPYLLLTLLIALVGAIADRQINQSSDHILRHLLWILLGMVFSIFAGFLLLLVVFFIVEEVEELESLGYLYGLVVSPTVVPIFTAITQALQQRPGMDKHFEEEDTVSS